MSWLKFSRSTGKISLFPGNENGDLVALPLGIWPAHNDAASTSQGRWPNGTWKWSHYNVHAEAGLMPGCHPSAYGCFGIHVFDVPGRTGMGVHAGRTDGEPLKVGGKTLGCVRVTPEAMVAINAAHNKEALGAIVVSD